MERKHENLFISILFLTLINSTNCAPLAEAPKTFDGRDFVEHMANKGSTSAQAERQNEQDNGMPENVPPNSNLPTVHPRNSQQRPRLSLEDFFLNQSQLHSSNASTSSAAPPPSPNPDTMSNSTAAEEGRQHTRAALSSPSVSLPGALSNNSSSAEHSLVNSFSFPEAMGGEEEEEEQQHEQTSNTSSPTRMSHSTEHSVITPPLMPEAMSDNNNSEEVGSANTLKTVMPTDQQIAAASHESTADSAEEPPMETPCSSFGHLSRSSGQTTNTTPFLSPDVFSINSEQIQEAFSPEVEPFGRSAASVTAAAASNAQTPTDDETRKHSQTSVTTAAATASNEPQQQQQKTKSRHCCGCCCCWW